MRTIWKYELDPTQFTLHNIPLTGNAVLQIGIDPNNKIAAWAEVDTDAPFQKCLFILRGTGNPIPSPNANEKYINTFLYGKLVLHAYLWIDEIGN